MSDSQHKTSLAGMDIRFGTFERRLRPSQTGTRLLDIRFRHLANIEPRFDLFQLLSQHRHILLLHDKGRPVAHYVHIGRDRVQQNELLGVAQNFPLRPDIGIGFADGMAGLSTAIDGLRCRQRLGARECRAIPR